MRIFSAQETKPTFAIFPARPGCRKRSKQCTKFRIQPNCLAVRLLSRETHGTAVSSIAILVKKGGSERHGRHYVQPSPFPAFCIFVTGIGRMRFGAAKGRDEPRPQTPQNVRYFLSRLKSQVHDATLARFRCSRGQPAQLIGHPTANSPPLPTRLVIHLPHMNPQLKRLLWRAARRRREHAGWPGAPLSGWPACGTRLA